MSMLHLIVLEGSLKRNTKTMPVTAPNANFNSQRKNLQNRLVLCSEIFKAISYNYKDARGKKSSYVLRL